MSQHKDNEETLTIDFPVFTKVENADTPMGTSADGLAENTPFAEDLLREVSELDAAETYCEPEPPLPAGSGTEEKRAYPRFLVNWKVVVMNEKNGKREFFHGRAHDISMGGLCLHSETNLVFTNTVIVLISVPPNSPKHKPHVLEVESKLCYTVLAHDIRQFRIGIRFVRFRDGDKRYLEQYFTERYEVFS